MNNLANSLNPFNRSEAASNEQPAEAQANPLSDKAFDHLLHDDRTIKDEMHRYGKTQAAQNQGDADCFEAELESVYEAYKRTSTKEWEAKEKDRIEAEGKKATLRRQIQGVEEKRDRQQSRLQEKIGDWKEQVAELKKKLKQVDQEQLETEPKNNVLNVMGTAILVLLGAALYIFYVNTAYKGFFADHRLGNLSDGQAIQSLQADSGIFDLGSFWMAFPAIWPAFAPMLVFGLGIGLHYILDGYFKSLLKTKTQQWTAILALLLFTLFVDSLLALKIHTNINSYKTLMGMETESWYASPNFWIVIAFGYVALLVWSAIFHGVMEAKKARNPYHVRKQQKAAYQEQLTQAENKLQEVIAQLDQLLDEMAQEIEKLELQIVEIDAHLEDDRQVITYSGKLKLCLESFRSGWLSYLRYMEMEQTPCKAVYQRFIGKHFNAQQSLSEEPANETE